MGASRYKAPHMVHFALGLANQAIASTALQTELRDLAAALQASAALEALVALAVQQSNSIPHRWTTLVLGCTTLRTWILGWRCHSRAQRRPHSRHGHDAGARAIVTLLAMPRLTPRPPSWR